MKVPPQHKSTSTQEQQQQQQNKLDNEIRYGEMSKREETCAHSKKMGKEHVPVQEEEFQHRLLSKNHFALVGENCSNWNKTERELEKLCEQNYEIIASHLLDHPIESEQQLRQMAEVIVQCSLRVLNVDRIKRFATLCLDLEKKSVPILSIQKSTDTINSNSKPIIFRKLLLDVYQQVFEMIFFAEYYDDRDLFPFTKNQRESFLLFTSHLHQMGLIKDVILLSMISELLFDKQSRHRAKSKEESMVNTSLATQDCLLEEDSLDKLYQMKGNLPDYFPNTTSMQFVIQMITEFGPKLQKNNKLLDHYIGRIKYLVRVHKKEYPSKLKNKINEMLQLKKNYWKKRNVKQTYYKDYTHSCASSSDIVSSNVSISDLKPEVSENNLDVANNVNIPNEQSLQSKCALEYQNAVKQLMSMGFTRSDAELSICRHNFDYNAAAEELLLNLVPPVAPKENRQVADLNPPIQRKDQKNQKSRKNRNHNPKKLLGNQSADTSSSKSVFHDVSLWNDHLLDKKLNIMYDILDMELVCPITCEIMKDPVILVETGHTYEKQALLDWLSKHNTDPITQRVLCDKSVITNYCVKNIISKFLAICHNTLESS